MTGDEIAELLGASETETLFPLVTRRHPYVSPEQALARYAAEVAMTVNKLEEMLAKEAE